MLRATAPTGSTCTFAALKPVRMAGSARRDDGCEASGRAVISFPLDIAWLCRSGDSHPDASLPRIAHAVAVDHACVRRHGQRRWRADLVPQRHGRAAVDERRRRRDGSGRRRAIALSRGCAGIDAHETFAPAGCGNVPGLRVDDPIRFVFVRDCDIRTRGGKRYGECCGDGMPSTGKAGSDSHDISPVLPVIERNACHRVQSVARSGCGNARTNECAVKRAQNVSALKRALGNTADSKNEGLI
nr:hypothetical protein [Burkholderia sp. MSMB1552]